MMLLAKYLALASVLAPLALAGDADSYDSPPYYPAPKGGWVSTWAEAYEKAHQVVSQMTLAEKVNLTTGTGFFMGLCSGQSGSALRVGIPQICYQDSPLGISSTDHSTYFPAGITVGATFDKELMHARGVALGEESRDKGVNVQLGPVVGPLGRKPRGGRNWEGFGADPTLQAIGGAETIKGMQSTGTIACLKHFIANEQELHRMTLLGGKAYSSNIDDRTLHELYLWPFAEGVRAGAGSVMIAYNDVSLISGKFCLPAVLMFCLGEQICLQPEQQTNQWSPQRRTGIPRIRGDGLVGPSVWCCKHLGWSGRVGFLTDLSIGPLLIDTGLCPETVVSPCLVKVTGALNYRSRFSTGLSLSIA